MMDWIGRVWNAYKHKLTSKLFGVVCLHTKQQKRGTALIAYTVAPFLQAPWEYLTDPHTSYWECEEMVRILLSEGYDVDVVDASNIEFVPSYPYTVAIDVKQNFKRWKSVLPVTCVKIMHITASESRAQNEAERLRLLRLKERRGVQLPMARQEIEGSNPEYADFLEGFGNGAVHQTYACFGKSIYSIPISVAEMFPFPEKKNWDRARSHFLFFGGGGAILKGLDLLVEAFALMPEATLHIIGPAGFEKGFCDIYQKELALPNIVRYPRPRISADGRMWLGDRPFSTVADICGTLLYPSASEGTSGAVVQAMHAGIFPIVTPRTGLHNSAPARLLGEDVDVDKIIRVVREVLVMPPENLRQQAYDAWLFARQRYTRQAFTDVYRGFVRRVIGTHQS